VHYWYDQLKLRHNNVSPSIEHVFHWLIKNVPTDELPPRFLHCGYANHNILIHNGRVSGILDWESAQIGDPAEDLSYFLQSTAGHIDPAQARRWYEEARLMPQKKQNKRVARSK
jgi:aminoglycoside phosphotransferase (APT) family kinase protein